uniref:Ribonuclease H-like domain-containing protein n=1 Tax=Tanacetum cinerariifolium TaxID=118510 RepID=A0A6L2LYD7_TANCI|nr:ribonuclease H-like domain-containing protein [Tanacetum cinerariifolium]
MSSPRAVAFTTGPSSVAGPLANLAPPSSYYYAGPTLLPAAYSHLVAQLAYSMAQPNLVAPIAHPTGFLDASVLLRCDSTRDLYPVTAPSPTPHAFLVSQHMWHQHLGHPGGEELRRLVSSNFISCNKEKPPSLCHACQLGKHVRLLFVSSGTVICFCFDIIHSDKKYAIKILEKAHMVSYNPSQTPIDTESKLGVDGDPVSDPTLYRSLAGTLNYGLQLFSSSTIDLVAYSDADWAGCPTTRRSTSGYCVFLGNNLLSWSAKRQPTLSRSNAEAEYRGVANAIGETCWLRNLLRELHTLLSSATLV